MKGLVAAAIASSVRGSMRRASWTRTGSTTRKELVMKVVAALVAALAGLVVTSAASAKELEAQICGESDCVSVPNRQAVMLMVDDRDRTGGSPPPASYYRVDFTAHDGPASRTFSHVYVPSARLLASGGDMPHSIAWFRTTDAVVAAISEATRGVTPYKAPAKWPTAIDDPVFYSAPAVSDDGRDWTPYVVGRGGAGVGRPPLGGRDAELELLENTSRRGGRDRRAHLFTIYGDPGVGK